MELKVQTTVVFIGIITALITLLLLFISSKLKKFDPLSEPKGIVLLVIMGYKAVDKLVKEKTNEKVAKNLAPYMASIFVYIFFSNIAGLFALECPTSNYSVTITLAAITCILIEVYSYKMNGRKKYIKSWFEPAWPFLPLNIISKFSTLLSLSVRLFGNILAGGILMNVIYQLIGMITAKIPVVGQINPLAIIIAPVLHFYFDLFAGAMQTFIFATLSSTFIGKEFK